MKNYTQFVRRKVLILTVSVLFLLVVMLLSSATGSVHLSLSQVFYSLFHRNQGLASRIIWQIRLVRVIAGIGIGINLALAGAVMQSVLENPLASPFTMGVSQGAAFGAAFSIVILKAGELHGGESLIISSPYTTTLFAFIGSLSGVLVVLLLAKARGFSPQSLILAGISMSFLFMAGLTLLQYFASDQELSAVVFWTFGDIGRITWREVSIIWAISIPAFAYFFWKRWDYNALLIGEDVAASLGVNTQATRLLGILIASLITSVCVAFAGVIGFIGLLGPHMTRGIVGSDHRFLLPASAMWGGILLLLADTVARTIISPVVLPVGIITAFLGVPLFLYILMKGEGK